MSKEWFILQYKPNSYKIAEKNLTRQGFETFFPINKITSHTISRFKNINQPLFPGYMFISFDIARSGWHKINNTYGVTRLITFNSTLRAVYGF